MADYNTIDSPKPSTSHPASTRSTRSRQSQPSSRTSEATPLLARQDSDAEDEDRPHSSAASSLVRSIHSSSGSKSKSAIQRRWPSILALVFLCGFTITIMLLGFFVPEVMEEYAMQAKEFELTSISLPSYTSTGARARVQGIFQMDASKVKKKSVRDLGRFGTWIARKVRSDASTVQVSLPEYGGTILGTADIPPVVVDIRNGRKTYIDFLADIRPGDVDGIRKLADDYIEGRLGQLRVEGNAAVKIRSGLISLGTQIVSQSMIFAGEDIPEMPKFNISKLNVHEINGTTKGMAADVSIWLKNKYPVSLTVPPLSFGLLVANCKAADPLIYVADASVKNLTIHPRHDINVNASGIVHQLPSELTETCPGTGKSPLDAFVSGYINGKETTVYVQGSKHPSKATPKWITELMSGITVPVPFPGRSFDKLVRNFTLADVHFQLPDSFAEPDTPESNPSISALIKVFIDLPERMNFPVDVRHIRADADVFYKGSKLGQLDLHKWQSANSTRIDGHGKEKPLLLVESAIKDAPLQITNDDAFTDVVQALLFGGKPVMLAIKAKVSIQLTTALGDMTVREIPAEGVVPIKRGYTFSQTAIHVGKGLTSISPKIGNLTILDTSPDGLSLRLNVNFTNPTNYSATVPYVDIKILTNNTVMGHATARDVVVRPGVNRGVVVEVVWEPGREEGLKGRAVGAELLSRYISSYNTTLSLKTHEGTIPSQPSIGRALSAFNITFPTPHLTYPKQPDDDTNPGDGTPPSNPSKPPPSDEPQKPHFIQAATFHLLTSTASFVLLSPLSHTTLYITSINATAFYKEDPVGSILYELPFAVPPGSSETPRLPVEWSLGSVGYEAVRSALGGVLRLHAVADVGLRIGRFEVGVWFRGGGIGAKVRL
ncbi:hypothetical protein EJ08DRAFT_631531 [Tothia fuscella]|uniref:Pre-rrna processing protein n=1 Tax=Tothia fuscella TaxID=1048955 RepID=A0A9P4TYX7_9PEZI|nr:hypothetical protein EJ08DRAFT_631531 [Tothia fuscella]